MKKYLIIGNGFDIAHNLPTKYSDFLYICNRYLSSIEKGQIINFLKSINKKNNNKYNIDNYIKLIKSYKILTFQNIKTLRNSTDIIHLGDDDEQKFQNFLFNMSFNSNYDINNSFSGMENKIVNKIKNKFYSLNDSQRNYKQLDKNFWFKHFCKTYNDSKNKWVDFETEIKNICEYLIGIFKSINSEYIELESIEIDDFYNAILNDDKSKYNVSLISFINKDQSVKQNINNLLNDLKFIMNLLNDYLLIINEAPINIYYSELLDYNPDVLISFNYTTYIKNHYDLNNCNCDFVHGDVFNKNIVLGIESLEDESKEIDFSGFIKYFQMINNNIKLNNYIKFQEECVNKDNHNDIAFFFGHSLDFNDKNIILNFIHNSKTIFISYYSKENREFLIKQLRKILTKEEFIKYFLSNNKKIYFVAQKKYDNIDNLIEIDNEISLIRKDNNQWINSSNNQIIDKETYLKSLFTSKNSILLKTLSKLLSLISNSISDLSYEIINDFLDYYEYIIKDNRDLYNILINYRNNGMDQLCYNNILNHIEDHYK